MLSELKGRAWHSQPKQSQLEKMSLHMGDQRVSQPSEETLYCSSTVSKTLQSTQAWSGQKINLLTPDVSGFTA